VNSDKYKSVKQLQCRAAVTAQPIHYTGYDADRVCYTKTLYDIFDTYLRRYDTTYLCALKS